MSKRRVKKVCKEIKKQPKLKKLLAEWLTEYTVQEHAYNPKKMLLEGNRGFLAMSEKELSDMFDKAYDALTERIEVYKVDLEDPELLKWDRKSIQSKIERLEEQIGSALLVYDEIFENIVF